MIRKLLVIRFSALGDIAMTVPVVASLCRQYPDLDVTVLTNRMGAKIYQTVLPDLANLKVRGVNPKTEYPGIAGLNKLYHELCQEHFDALADLHDVLRTRWLGLRYALGRSLQRSASIYKGRKEKKDLVKHRISRQLKTSFERYCDVFAELGFPVSLDFTPVPLTSEKVEGEYAIGVAPFAQHAGKIYPKELMLKVIGGLLDRRSDVHVYLFGGPNEARELESWTSLDPTRITNTAGKQTLADDLRLMSRLDCMVSMDSANMHLASLVGCRVVSIWGATDIKSGFLGYRQSPDDVVSLPLECRPCSVYGNKPCKKGNYECMWGITPDSVVQRVFDKQ